MGESRTQGLRVGFDRSVELQFHGAKTSSDAGLMLHRELDDVPGLTEQGERVLNNTRTGKNTLACPVCLVQRECWNRPPTPIAGTRLSALRVERGARKHSRGRSAPRRRRMQQTDARIHTKAPASRWESCQNGRLGPDFC